jgi:hypothetical protein
MLPKRDKDKDAKRTAEALKKAAYKGISTEQIKHEGVVAQDMGIPTTWYQGETGVKIRGKEASISTPSDQDTASFAVTPRRTICGDCKFFDLEAGRKEIIRQGFAERLAKEMEWNPDHVGAPPDSWGLCGASGGEMITSTHTLACDQYRRKK